MRLPYHKAKDLDVDIPPDDWGRINDCIDDGISIFPDIEDNRNWAVPAMLLAVHTTCRPLDKNEHIMREYCLSFGKLKEGGALSVELIILGWTINTHLLTIAFPHKKFKYWHSDLKQIIVQENLL
jgi:hypothetical protein